MNEQNELSAQDLDQAIARLDRIRTRLSDDATVDVEDVVVQAVHQIVHAQAWE